MSEVILDKSQKVLNHKFLKLASEIKSVNFLGKLTNLLFDSPIRHSGVYLYGNVGSGKTMLMQQFYKQLTVPKKIVHYQQFMQKVHEKMHNLQNTSAHKVVQDLAKEMAKSCRVICMDEFEIKDIADAMIIMRLFKYLQKHSVFIFVTTNIEPDNLYMDGLQRWAFLPFIEMLKRRFEILHLESEKDYRFNVIANIENRVLFPASQSTAKELQNIKSKLCIDAELSEVKIEVFGRDLLFKKAHSNILVTDFAELFERDLGYADYVTLSEKFEIIILSSVRCISEDEGNLITRFINFIDNAYFNRVLLFIEIDCAPEELYISTTRNKEFERTVSRLNEMNSKNYLHTENNRRVKNESE
jgi:cell division protein ZapE